MEEAEILERFIEHLPTRPYATNDPRTGLHIVGKDRALKAAYVQLNGVMRRYLPFDVDRLGAAFAWEEVGLPPPTIVTINPVNAHAHLLYELAAPVAFPDSYGNGRAKQKPMNYYKAVKEAYRRQLDADPSYRCYTTKNPLHGRWERLLRDRRYELGELAEYVNLREIRPFDYAGSAAHKLDDIEPVILEGFRNDTVFEYGRNYAYGQVRMHATYESFFDAVEYYCLAINANCLPPLSEREVFSIGRSIVNYCWNRRDSIRRHSKNVGVMGFEPLPAVMEATARREEISTRKQRGAEYTATIKAEKTSSRIQATIDNLKTQNKRVTVSAVARMLGMDRARISMRYRHLFQ